ncbi:DUF234 domain-containing protein [Campylobacter geochelonis]|uniref:ATPase n=1 Tax=Campylobacter geochelonis TaxID=1780362 RepID=A0A128EQ18_9BACT|nr:DUF234 domain-containing protein [Campylobacter geochelonis]CZE47521.1 ATPase [Campylobacter geochelonis]CZE48453.1 ATPase [Campylobacter geochelonis]CZE51201.1 ATPase [Campylobacter geochelonis]
MLNELFRNGFLILEKSREKKPTPKCKNEKLPRELRRYTVHDKVHFKSHFMRFWFRFIQPNLALLEAGKIDEILEIIRDDFDNYCSLGFELLSANLLKKHFKNHDMEIYSFWTKEFEMDIFADYDGDFIVGEVKYKERKVCKNLLNLLELKCEKLKIKPKFIALFSKSGFSKELTTLKRDDLLLFEMEDFKLLLT